MSYSVARIEDIEELNDGRQPWRPVRHHFGIASFGVNAWTGSKAGDQIINEHDESDDTDHDELYVVLDGHARFELDGEKLDAPAGMLVHVERGVKRVAFAKEANTTILAFGGQAGRAYTAVGWEVWAPLNELYRDGKYAETADRGRALVEKYPNYPLPLYNLACCESLAGRTDDALGHLRQAIEMYEPMREYARHDSDLDAIRAAPGFAELVP